MAQSSDFLANLLESMGYPNLESAHQALLAAALKTKPELLPLMLEGATVYREDGSEFQSSAASPIQPWGKADCWPATTLVRLEETPRLQTQGLPYEPKCRFDIVVRNGTANQATRATAVIECKWGAGTSTHQLLRYGKLLNDDKFQETYARPLLLLVSVDGAPPRSPAKLAQKCGVPVVFVTWEKLNPVIRAALGEAQNEARKGLEGAIHTATRFLTDFGALVMGHQRIPLRHPEADVRLGNNGKSAKVASPAPADSTEDEEGNADDRETGDFESRKQWRMLGTGVDKREFDNATLPERFALFQLAKALEMELNQRNEGAGWRMVSPPHLGPRGDVQCDLAPRHGLRLPFADDEVRQPGDDADPWLLPVGEFVPTPSPGDDHAKRNARAFEVAKSHDVDDNGIYLRAIIRLYFSTGGEFSVSFGAGVEPYLIGMLPKKLRPTLDAHIGAVGNFSSKGTGSWQAGETLTTLHNRWVKSFGSGLPRCWVKAGRYGERPTMWQRYAEIRDIKGDAPEGTTRVARIANAIGHLLNGGCDCMGGTAKTSGGDKPKRKKAPKGEGTGWYADFYRACNEALRAAGHEWYLHHSRSNHYSEPRGIGLPYAKGLGVQFPIGHHGRGYVTFQQDSDHEGRAPNTPEWQAAVDCERGQDEPGPVLGHNQKTWRCFICEVVHEGERGNEASIPAAVQRTIEALQAVVHDMSTRLTGC